VAGSKPKLDAESDLARQASENPPSLVRELLQYVRARKRWWLVPILIVLLLVGLFVVLGGTALGPFLYPLF
jgi:hypothetical protein